MVVKEVEVGARCGTRGGKIMISAHDQKHKSGVRMDIMWYKMAVRIRLISSSGIFCDIWF